MPKIIINGKEHVVDSEDNLLEVIRADNIPVPSPCYKSERVKEGWCKLCLIKIEGEDDFQPACTTKIIEGMVVITESDSIEISRKANLEILFKKHYKEELCRNCIWEGECELHDLAREYDILKK